MNRWLSRLRHLPRDTRDTLFLLVVIAWVMLPQLGRLPPWCSALAAALLLWRGWLAWTNRPLPGRWWLVGLLLLSLGATWATYRTLLGRDAGVALVVLLLALKTLEMRARRDALVVFFLGFFAMLTNFFHSQSLPTAAAMLIGLLGLLTALVNAHRPVGQPSLRESAGVAARMALAGAPVMVALFLLFPRFAPLWGLPSDGLTGRSGLSSSMTVGNVAELALDDGIAMRVRFDGAVPPRQQLYFRGPVLSRFDGRQWTARGGASGFEAVLAPGPADLVVSGSPIRYQVTLEPSQRPWLLTLDVAPTAPELAGPQHPRMTADMQWLSARPVTELLRYRAESYTGFQYGLSGRDGRPRQDLGAYLQLPPGFNPRTLALAEQLKRELPDAAPDALVRAALERLRNGGYRYTLEPGLAGPHSADEFWFDTRAGFCEHIASAFVVLMRAAGVPARIVTGFQGGELNPVDGYWTVRNADAHAWAEVWLAGAGWQRVDPTSSVAPGRIGQLQRLRAPDGLVAGALGNFSPTLLAHLRAFWEAGNNRWNQWVLNYTQTRQFELLRALGFAQPSRDDLARLLAALLTLAALGAAAWARWERGQHDPWLRLLAAARRRLARAGVEVPPHAPPRQLAQAVAASDLPPALSAPLQAWLLAMEQWRYAPAASAGAAPRLATLRRQYRRFSWPRRS